MPLSRRGFVPKLHGRARCSFVFRRPRFRCKPCLPMTSGTLSLSPISVSSRVHEGCENEVSQVVCGMVVGLINPGSFIPPPSPLENCVLSTFLQGALTFIEHPFCTTNMFYRMSPVLSLR